MRAHRRERHHCLCQRFHFDEVFFSRQVSPQEFNVNVVPSRGTVFFQGMLNVVLRPR